MSEWHKRFIRSTLREAIRGRAAIHAHGRLIDIGCGTKQYERLLAPYVTEHVGVDHALGTHGLTKVDIVSSAYDIPVADASFDTALMTEVLERLEQTLAALVECAENLAPRWDVDPDCTLHLASARGATGLLPLQRVRACSLA